MKTYILAAHCNNLNYIDFQYKSLKKHFKGEYEYIVINDAKEFGDITNFNQHTMKEKIENLTKGPLLVYGNLTVKDAAGNAAKKSKVTAFCRCGHSGNKPYCDGSHVTVKFEG